MPLHYCSNCAAKVTYEATKPSACPKCRKPIKDAAAMLAQIPPPVSVTRASVVATLAAQPLSEDPTEGNYDNSPPPDDAPLRRPAHSQHSTPVVRKERRPTKTAAKLYEGEEDGDRALGGNSEHYDRHEAKRLAREWAAAFEGEGGISLGELKAHETTTFGALWKAGEAEREKGAAS